MTFRIIGDEIEYEYKPFARIVAPVSTLRDYAEGEIWNCDAKAREAADQKWREEIESEYETERENMEAKIEELTFENERLHTVLGEIDDGDACLDLIAKAQAETAKWREIAETNREAYLQAIRPKPRKRRTPT